MALTESLKAQALRELISYVCAACGRDKNRGQSFCKSCYFFLTPDERASLYEPMSNGYAEIYDELKTKLRAERT